MRVARMPRAQAREQLERPLRLLLVPEIDDVELVVGLAAQRAARRRAPAASPEPLHAVAARQEQQPAQHLGRGGRHVGVVVVQADAEVRVLQLGSSASARSSASLIRLPSRAAASVCAAQHPPLRAGAVRAAQVEPGFGALRLPFGPRSVAAIAASTRAWNCAIAGACCSGSSWNLPPERHGSSSWQASAGAGRTRLPQAARGTSSKRASKMAS